MIEPKVSVIICTHNRQIYLARAIGSLCQQTYPIDKYEIIVVDNASEDDTRIITEKLQGEKKVLIRYVFEPQLGLSYARNAGALTAQSEFVAYIDDDVFVAQDWLEKLAFEFERDKLVACVGGRIDLDWEAPRPDWLSRELETYLGCNHHLGFSRRELPPDLHPFEGNFAVYRNLVLEVGGFDTQFGMVGNKIGAHDGTRLVDHLRQRGKIIYTPEAVVYHNVPEWRTRPTYFFKRGFRQGMGDARLGQARQPRTRVGLLRALAADLVFLAKEMGNLLAAVPQGPRSRLFYRLVVVLIRFGAMWGRLHLIVNLNK